MDLKHKLIKMVIGLLAITLFPIRVAAQAQTIRFERMTAEDGLSQNAILSIAQDAQGFLWVGTEDGLNKYDGYHFTVYKHDPDDPSTLRDNFVSALYIDQTGDLWIGTRSGLDRFDRSSGTFLHYPQGNESTSALAGSWVISLYQDQSGTLWIGTEDGGLNGLDHETGTLIHYAHDNNNPDSLIENAVRVIFEDSAGNMWIGTHDGLDLFDRTSGEFVHYRETDSSDETNLNDISSIAEDQEGNLWLGTEESGIARFDPTNGTFRRFRYDQGDPYSLSNDRVRSIYRDHLGDLWIGTQNGLNYLSADRLKYDSKNPRFLHYKNDPYDPTSLGSSAVWSIFEDASGVMWFGTYGGGLNKHNRSTDRFKLYQHNPTLPNSISDNMIWAIHEDREGNLWIGTLNGGLNVLNRETDEITVYRHDEADPASLLSDDVRAIIQDESGVIWIGTAGGLEQYDPTTQSFIHYTNNADDPNSLSGNRVIVLIRSQMGGIWVGTRYNGLNYFDPAKGTFKRYLNDPSDPTSISDDRIWSLYEDRNGTLWVGTLGGINVLEPGSDQFVHYRHDPDDATTVSSDSIFAFNQDRDGTLWVGTWGGGLNRFNPLSDTFERYTTNDGLPDDTIYGIEVDFDGALWMSTNRGLSRLNPRLMEFKNFTMRDGLQDNEFNVGAHYRSLSTGELFFGGIQGINAFYPNEIQQNPHVPPIVITTFYKYNQPIRHDLQANESIELSYKDNFIAFDFTALDFYAPENNQYAYRLEGFEDWVDAGTRRYVSYTNLEGGEYVFRVKGSNSDGIWNEEGAAVFIKVIPPLWQTMWFQLLAATAILSLAYSGYRLNIRRIERRSQELELLVTERTQEIEQHKNELDALYQADEELMQHLDIDHVFQTLLDITVKILKADKGALLYWDDQLNSLVVRAALGFKSETLEKVQFKPGVGAVGWVMETGEPFIVHDVAEEPQVMEWFKDLEGVHSLMHMPIKGEDRVYGVLNVDYLEPRGFGVEEQRLLQALAQRAALAIEQAQLQHEAQKTAIYEERQRLARDLHDAVTQTLFSASLVSEVLPVLWEKDPAIGRDRLKTLNELTKGALAEMRTLLIELRPSAIEEAELVELIRQLAESTTGRARIPVEVQFTGECDLTPEEKVVLYRIAQEALNNITKHAEANHVTIRIECDASRVELTVEDDGVGFNPGSALPDRLGLGIMKERAESIGANLSVESKPKAGTRVKLSWDR